MSDFMEKHFRHLRDGRKEYTEAEVRLIIEGALSECREKIALKVEEMGMQGFGTLAIAASIRRGND
jgi:hypothetical protein